MPPELARYLEFMQDLSLARLADAGSVIADDVEFIDPFNHLRGRHDFVRCLEDMLAQLADLRITVTHAGLLEPLQAPEAEVWCLRWHFSGKLRRLGHRDWAVTGMSEVALAADGRVARHVDFWDAARGLYEELPGVGAVQRWLRRRLAVAGVRQLG